MVPAAGLAASSWRIQGTAGAQPDSASPTCGAASMYTGEKSERRKRKLEAEDASVKPYACRFCSQSFDKSQALGGHMNRHRQEREREQLDNAQKLVLKQQSLQGLSGLPIQTLNQSAKLQGPTSLVSFDQVTLSRYNQLEAVQYQSNPRSFLPGPGPAYSTLHCGGSLVNLTAGTWNSNVGEYGTGSLASTNTLGNIETSADSDMARVNGGATPEDLFAASVFQSAVATPPSTSLLSGRTNDADPAADHDAAAEQDMIYGYPGMTQTEASMSMTDNAAAASCPEFNFNNIRQSFQTFPQTPGGNVHLGLYCGAQAHDSQRSVTHAVVDVASPRDLLGQSNDPAENDPEDDMKYAYPAAVSNLTPCACQPELEVSTCSNNSSCQQLNVGSHARNNYDTVTVTQVPSSLAAANMPLFSLTTVQASHDQLTIPQNQAGETTGDVPGSISGRSAAQGSMCADGEVATHQSVLFTGTVEHDIYKACAAAAPHVQCHVVLQNRQEKDLRIVQVPEDCTGTSSPTLELVSFMGRSALQDRQFLAAQMSELETSGSWKEPGSQMGSGPSLQQTVSSSSSEQFFADSAPVSKDSPAGTTADTESGGLALHPWMLGDGKRARSCHSLVVESSEVLSKRVISTLTPTATGPAEQHFVGNTSSSFLQEARELDASGYIKVEDPSCALEYGSQLETGSNPCYDNITEQPWRSRSESTT